MKNKFFLGLIFLSFALPLFSQNKNFRSLSFDYELTIKAGTGTESVQKGSIEYSFSPFIFVFTAQVGYSPKIITWINPDGIFTKNNGKVSSLEEGESTFYEFCRDYLRLIQADWGFGTNYLPNLSYFDKSLNAVATEWYRNPENYDSSIPRSLTTWVNKNNQLIKCESKDTKKESSSTWYFSDFYSYNGKYFPKTVIFESKKNGVLVSTKSYVFSNIVFNQPVSPEYTSNIIQLEEVPPLAKINQPSKYGIAEEPASGVYRTSIAQVSVNTAFKFYKKFITEQDASNCLYSPTCSQYMLQAVSKNGLWGIFQGIDRLKRCNNDEHTSNLYIVTPDGKHYDPVP